MEVHVAPYCAVPNSRWVEYVAQLDTLTTQGMTIGAGRATPGGASGLGIAWDFPEIEKQAAAGSRKVVK